MRLFCLPIAGGTFGYRFQCSCVLCALCALGQSQCRIGCFFIYLSCGFSFSGAQTRRRLPLTSSGSGVVAADVVVICVVCAGKSENLEIDTPGRK